VRRAWCAGALLCALFIGLGVPWIDRPGLQTDEVLFAGGIYPPFDPRNIVRIFRHPVPIMVMSYVGAAKAHLWASVFKVWRPSAASVRIPALLLGTLSVWWFFRLLEIRLGARSALEGAALLATDPLYILYSRWDHRPVVL